MKNVFVAFSAFLIFLIGMITNKIYFKHEHQVVIREVMKERKDLMADRNKLIAEWRELLVKKQSSIEI